MSCSKNGGHLDEVPAIIVDFTDQQMMEIALLRKYSKRRFKCNRRSTSLSNNDGKTST